MHANINEESRVSVNHVISTLHGELHYRPAQAGFVTGCRKRRMRPLPPDAETQEELFHIYKANTGRTGAKKIKGKPVDLLCIFKAVRREGGFEYVEANG